LNSKCYEISISYKSKIIGIIFAENTLDSMAPEKITNKGRRTY
jgi:hypothetical protein